MKWIDYASPSSLSEAVDLLAQHGDRARILAGGTDIIVQLRTGRRTPDLLIDAKTIPELNEMTYDPSAGLTLGATVSCYQIYGDKAVSKAYPGLIDSASLILRFSFCVSGTTQILGKASLVSGRASIGGNLCNAVPSADSVPGYQIYGDKAVSKAYPGLIDSASLIGGTQIQGRASIGGNLCNAVPSADSVPGLIAMGVSCKITGPNGTPCGGLLHRAG